MVRVLPFRALRYDTGRTDLARVTTPPHDVITASQMAAARSEGHSIVHLVLPEGGEGRFHLAAQRLAEWQREGILVRDATPALYRYEVTPEDGRPLRALFARVGLDATLQEVRPHERILSRKKGDRLRLRQETACDLEPIWLIYRDAAADIDALLAAAPGEEQLHFVDGEGRMHRVWRVTDARTLQEVTAWFAKQVLVIADGHHRYQSALEHHAASGRAEHASILACLSRDGDEGIAVEATHRLVLGRTLAEAIPASRTAWRVMELPQPRMQNGTWGHAARELLQSLAGPGTAVVVGRGEEGLRAYDLRLQVPHAATDLAVTLVQERLLFNCWGLEESAAGAIAYDRDAAECLRRVATRATDLAILLPAERVESVLDAAKLGRLMPAKATYFTPKPASGLVLAPLDEV